MSYTHLSIYLSNRLSRRTNDGASVIRWTVSRGRRLVRQQLPHGSFGPFPLCLNPKLRHFDPKSSDFSQFKPRNISKTYPSQIIKSKLRKLEKKQGRRKNLKNPSSRMPQALAVQSPKLKYFSVDFITKYVGFH